MKTGQVAARREARDGRRTGRGFANHTENHVMTVYMPILKGRASEFLALGKVAAERRPSVRPLIEVMPLESDTGDGDRATIESVAAFEKRVEEHLPAERVFAVDCHRLLGRHRNPDDRGVMSMVSNAVRKLGYRMIPVVRPEDGEHAFRSAGYAAAQHRKGACLRVPWAAPRTSADDARLSRRIRDHLGLEFKDIDLVLDLWAVDSDALLKDRTADAWQALTWAKRLPVRSITLAAGAFPRTLDDVPFDTPVAIPRRDAALWTTVAASYTGTELSYADYGVFSPRVSQGRNPHPNLRYAVDGRWYAYRCERREGTGALGGFDDLCKAVVADLRPSRGTAFSWGDEQIERFADGQPLLPRRPESWHACSLSRHFATVLDRLGHLRRP
ncbi:beta family protein [Streptosporangium sp. G11]|uniref:beta family protein n=1 Tax=Streptosporangium sp. G11 TaxID=3436926 RepID=UPI003EBB05E6